MRHVAVPGWVWCSGALLTCVCNPGLEGMTVVVRGVCRRRVRRAAGGVMIRSRCEILEGEAAVRAAFEGRAVAQTTPAPVNPGAVASAPKRVVLKIVPEKIVSWDHRKLDGKY